MTTSDVMQEEELAPEVRSSIVSHMVLVHQSVRTFSARFQEQLRRSNYVTPKNYLDFIHNYKHALADNRTTFSSMAARLDGGLQKLIQVTHAFSYLAGHLPFPPALHVPSWSSAGKQQSAHCYCLSGNCMHAGFAYVSQASC